MNVTEPSLFPEVAPDRVHSPPGAEAFRHTPATRDVLDAVRRAGALDDVGIAAACALRSSQVDHALAALARAGLVIDTGQRGRWTARGSAIVWRAAP